MSPQEPPAQDRADVEPRPSRVPGAAVLILALVPALAAIWATPTFVTQDGPAHLYNAQILARSLSADSPFRGVFEVRWSPLPNWSGHLLLIGLQALVSPGTADRLATSITLVGFAASIYWLRRRVAGPEGEVPAALLSAMLGLNVAWLFGFASFVLGACLFPITLGVWWNAFASDLFLWRDDPPYEEVKPSPRRTSLKIAALIVLGYFAHLVSLGLTVAGLGVLAIATPGFTRARLGWTALSLSPLLVLGPIYRGLMGRGGPIEPEWGHLKNPASLASWREQLGWVDPITLGRKVAIPFVSGETAWLGLVSPVALLLAALAILAVATCRRPDPRLRGWLALAGLLLIGGVVTPDTLGQAHGNYLPQRVVLLGLVALVPWLRLEMSSRSGRVATAILSVSIVIQSLSVWDYARECSERIGPFARGLASVGTNRRIGTLLVGIRGRFRPNPLLHADNLLGVGTGNVVWSDYETVHYYFPVQFRPGLPRPPARVFEAVAILDDPRAAADRDRIWEELVSAHHEEIDVLVVWGRDPALDAVNVRWFEPEPFFEDGALRMFHSR